MLKLLYDAKNRLLRDAIGRLLLRVLLVLSVLHDSAGHISAVVLSIDRDRAASDNVQCLFSIAPWWLLDAAAGTLCDMLFVAFGGLRSIFHGRVCLNLVGIPT